MTPARIRIRKTGIQNIDEMPLTKTNGSLKVREEESSAERPPHQRFEMQELGDMKCTSKSTPPSIAEAAGEHAGLFGGLFFWEENEQQLGGILQTFLICENHIWHCYYRWKTKSQKKAGQLTQNWKSMISIKAIAKV